MGMDLGISALASSMASQSLMGQLLVKTLDQTQQLVKSSAAVDLTQSAEAIAAQIDISGLGENIDLTA
ncbi:MAG: hypothetical protein GC154_03580 [bacterium]|nr:hypothetical protein [bacterium]